MKWRLARFLRVVPARVVLSLYRTRLVGIEHVPATGAIIAGNHVSYLDPVLLWCGSPRPVHFMAKAELWSSAFIGWLLPRLWAFPVRRGEADRAAISTATELLAAGEIVGIFPEGTRQQSGNSELGAANEGVAFLAIRAGVPVVPVGIVGTEKALPRGAKVPRFPRVTFVFGPPVDPALFSEGGRKERVRAMTESIMESIAKARARALEG